MKTLRPFILVLVAGLSASVAISAGAHGDEHDETTAIGKPGVAARAVRTVAIDMSDAMRFTPADIRVKQNETVRLVVTNSGKVKHELMLGTDKELKAHYEVMKRNPEMEHDDANQVSLAPGATGEIVWQFTQPGKVEFACLQPGHLDAGMKGFVNVAHATQKPTGK